MNYSRQRELILETLKENVVHPTAEYLYCVLQEKDPSISMATLYRNLNQLAENGIIKKIDGLEAPSHFDHNTHEHFYTFKLLDTPTEIVNLHLVANGCLQKPEFKKINKQEKPIEEMIKEVRPVYFAEKGWLDTKVYDREKLGAGFKVSGPAIIEEVSSSTIVLEKQTLTVDDYGNLIIEMEGK